MYNAITTNINFDDFIETNLIKKSLKSKIIHSLVKEQIRFF
jgi:hypothetical protein